MKNLNPQSNPMNRTTRSIRFLVVLSLLTSLVSASWAANISWTNGTASYTVALNWDSNAVPGAADNAVNNNGTNNVVQINPADPSWTVIDVLAGTVAGTGGAFEQNGSTLNLNPGWFRLGLASNSLGVFTLNDGTLNLLGGRIQTGEGPDSSMVININGGEIRKSGGGLGLNLSDGGWGGAHSATTLVNQTAGTIYTSGDIWIGQWTGGVATYNLHGGAINSSNWFVVSRSGGIGTLNMDGGVITHEDPDHNGQPAFIIADRAGNGGGVGTFNFSGGTVSTIGAEYWIGNGEAAAATNNMSGNASLTVNHWMAIGRENSIGELNLSGTASVTKTGSGNLVIGTGGGVGGLGIINQNGGTFTVSSGQVWLGENGVANGFWHLNSGDVVLGVLDIAHNNTANGTFNLNGGTLTATEVRKGASAGVAAFNFNGGTLRAAADNPSFMHGLDTADVQSGGVVIDSQGFNIDISQSLFDGSASGGGLTKNGSGTLKLTGANFYSGATLINAGKLLASTAAFGAGDHTVADGAGFGVTVAAAFGQFYPPNLTLGTSGATTLDFDLGAFGNPFAAPLSVSGTLAVNSTVTVNITDDLPQVGQFPLIQYGLKTGTGSFVIGNLPVGVVATIVDNVANSSIDLNITGVASVRWDGTINGDWDIAATTNWINPGTGLPATYADGNPAIFNDLATGTTLVNLTTTVSPNGVSVNNTSPLDYTFVGSGKISGPINVIKEGSGTLSVLNTGGNDYSGRTVIEGGVLSVTNLPNGGLPSPIGAASASPTNLVLSGGLLAYAGPGATTDRGYSVVDTNSGIQADGNLTLTGPVAVSPATAFLKTGTATLAYAQTGTNLIGSGGVGGNPGVGFVGWAAFNAIDGTVLLDGTGGGQTIMNQGELWVGGTTNSGAALVLSNSTLNSSSWVAVGRGNGTSDFLSSVTLNDSVLNVNGGGFSAGYDADLPLNLGLQILARQEVTLNGNSVLNVPNGSIFLAERRGANCTMKVNDTSAVTNNNNMGIGIGGGGSLSGSTGSVEIAQSAVWRSGAWISIGNEGGTGSLLVKDNGAFFTGSDLNVTDVGASTGTLTVQDNAVVGANNLFVGKDNGASGVLTITNNATVVSSNGLTMARYWQGYAVVPTLAEVNLGGGSLAVNLVQGSATNSVAQGTFNFNGGRLIARNPIGDNFMFDLAAINVLGGGAVIDSDTNSISITQSLLNGGGGGGLTKLGSGALYLNGANTYLGTTLVSAGTLGGTGSISGPVTVDVGGSFSPGTSVGTMTINNSLSLSGNTVIELDKSLAQSNDVVNVTGALSYGGTLTVNNIGTNALVAGDTFTVFPAGGGGSFASIDGGDATFSFNNGVLTVVSVGAPELGWVNLGGGVIQFTIPAGSKLVYQTNSLSAGLSNNWIDYPISGSPILVTNNPAIGTMFFGLQPQ